MQQHPPLPSVKWSKVRGCGAKRLQLMKRLLAISIASTSIAIGAIPAVAEVNLKVHNLCVEARDYTGCVRTFSRGSLKFKDNQLVSKCKKYLDTADPAYFDCLYRERGQKNGYTGNNTSTRISSDDVEVSPGFTYRKSTVKQLKIRGSYGRYLTFWGRSANSYKGTSATYLPGNPGSVDCNYNEYGLNSFDVNSPLLEYGSGPLLEGNSTTNTYGNLNCHRSGYVAPTYIPGTPGGIQRGWFEYDLDCRDGTHNRREDISQGIYKKGWQDIYYDPTAKAVAARYCRRITSLPLKIDPEKKKKKCKTIHCLQGY